MQSEVFQDLFQSHEEQAKHFSPQEFVRVTKSVCQTYVSKCFNDPSVAEILPIISEIKKFNFQMHSLDPSIDRQMQLVRMWNELKQSLPCIVINDNGHTYIPSGLEHSETTQYKDEEGRTRNALTVRSIFKIPIDLLIGTTDRDSTNLIHNAVALVFGPFRQILSGSELNYRGSIVTGDKKVGSWQVTLPKIYTATGATRLPIGDDPKDSIWQASINFEAQFEGTSHYKVTTGQHAKDHTQSDNVDIDARRDQIINSIPDDMYMGNTYEIRLNTILESMRVTNNQVLAFSSTSLGYTVRALRPGNCRIIVTSEMLGEFEKEVTVLFK